MAAYCEETIRAGANATLLMTTLLNDTALLVEIAQGRRHPTESEIGDIATRVEKARWSDTVNHTMRTFFGDDVRVLPIYNYLPPTLDYATLEKVRKWFSVQMGDEYPQTQTTLTGLKGRISPWHSPSEAGDVEHTPKPKKGDAIVTPKPKKSGDDIPLKPKKKTTKKAPVIEKQRFKVPPGWARLSDGRYKNKKNGNKKEQPTGYALGDDGWFEEESADEE